MGQRKIIVVIGATGAQGGGLVRAILADKDGPFAARAVTRHSSSDSGKTLAALGVEVVVADADDPASLDTAFAGAYGAYCMTSFWEHASPEGELRQATAMARATRRAGLQHVVWSTLEDTRKWVPLSDDRLPTLRGKYKVPHFDAKGEADAVFAAEAAPTSYLLPAFYWENFIRGSGPRTESNGELVLSLPLGGAKLPGISAADIGKCAYGIFRRGAAAAGQRFGIAGEILSGDEMAAKMGAAIGRTIRFVDVPFDVYRRLGFPGADDLGNMFEFQKIRGDNFYRDRDPSLSRLLNPELLNFDRWLAANAHRISAE